MIRFGNPIPLFSSLFRPRLVMITLLAQVAFIAPLGAQTRDPGSEVFPPAMYTFQAQHPRDHTASHHWALLVQYEADGSPLASVDFGCSGELTIAQVVMNERRQVLLIGAFSGQLRVAGHLLESEKGLTGFMLVLDEYGEVTRPHLLPETFGWPLVGVAHDDGFWLLGYESRDDGTLEAAKWWVTWRDGGVVIQPVPHDSEDAGFLRGSWREWSKPVVSMVTTPQNHTEDPEG
ncbi:hypothetical protein SCOR_24155 [Sulfidibacter corallicola]|uniref:Uncharacterized protein n=1 Tax=Sulfidibacter corallicola TaxID=2818388 RepID=A0A8A4TSY8_SULCO|nr:hypothetical protein [Sulfidibacter corallicola]QTD52497.1 hypothetical protein J3U87_08495 [Sulfidibacter corallicola]